MNNNLLIYKSVNKDREIEQIIELQQANIETSVDKAKIEEEGFVTVIHQFELLKQMNKPFAHSIVCCNDRVIAYALVMLPKFKDRIPVLKPMFKLINSLSFNNKTIDEREYFVMGQVCVAEDFRKQGIFRKLYEHLFQTTKTNFKYCITEVAFRNQRSLQAHISVGFEVLHKYETVNEKWLILIYRLRVF